MKSWNLARAYVKNIVMANLSDKHTLDPMVATYYVTQLCNFRCNYCEDFSADKNDFYRDKEVPTETAKQILTTLRKDCDVLYMTGGEPLLRNDIEEICAHAKALGFAYVGMNTNGLLLPSRERVLDSLNNIVISLDSMSTKKLDDVWGVGDGTAQKVLDIIVEYAHNKKGRKYTMTVNCVAGPDTVEDCEAVMEFCFEHGVEFTMSPQNVGVQPHPTLRDNEQYRRFVRRIVAERRAGKPISGSPLYYEHMVDFTPFQCYPTLSARVDPQGNVSFPCRPLEHEGKVGGMAGNLLEVGSLKEILARGKSRWGERIECHDRCYLRCHAEMSLLVKNPAHLLSETVSYLARAVRPPKPLAMTTGTTPLAQKRRPSATGSPSGTNGAATNGKKEEPRLRLPLV